MNEDLAKKILDYLQKTEDFALEHLPDVVLQALRYHTLMNWLFCISMTVLILVSASLAFYFYRYPGFDSSGHRTFPSFFVPFGGAALSIIFFALLCQSIDTLIQMYMAPKYYLMILIKSMIYGGVK